MNLCPDCGAALKPENHGWCLSPSCCGLGGATADGRELAYQDRLAAFEQYKARVDEDRQRRLAELFG